MSANDRQVAGNHYQAKVQHWDFIILHLENRYLEGQITKYLSRWRKKAGRVDLEKSGHFFDKLIEAVELGYISPRAPFKLHELINAVHEFCSSYELTPVEASIVMDISRWRNIDELRITRRRLQAFIDTVGAE